MFNVLYTLKEVDFVLKFHLYDKHRQLLKDWRNDKGKGYSAEEVSEMIGHHKSWLGQIERGRLVSIKQEDLSSLLSIILDIPKEEITEDLLENFIYNYNPFYEEPKETVTSRIINKIYDSLPNSEISIINTQLYKITNTLKQTAQKCDRQRQEDLWLFLSSFNDNLDEDALNTMAFAGLPYHLLFKKYKDNLPKMQDIYKHISQYIEECIDEESD